MDKMQQALAEQDHPPYIAEMQQQMQSMQDTMTHLEQITTNMRQDITDVEIMANYVHDTLYTQQQKDASIQTVAKGWPTNFSESERDSVIQWYAEKAGVRSQFTATHGRYMYRRYKKSPITILHWQSEWAKNTFESYIYKHYNKWHPVTIWDWKNNMVYHGQEFHRISFAPQTSEMERQVNLTMQAALHILTKSEQSDLAGSWNRLAAKWQDKLAIKTSDNMVVFKIIRDHEDSKQLHLHIHKDYYNIIYENWMTGWQEANAKTKCPNYNDYVYIVKFAVLRSNEEYRAMRDAKFGNETTGASASHEADNTEP